MVLVVKTCSRCRVSKPRESFSPHRRGQLGCQPSCRDCRNEARHRDTPRARTLREQRALRATGRKRCRACGEVKALGDFPRNGANHDGLQPLCRPCDAADWRARNPTAAETVRHRQWRADNPEVFRPASRRRASTRRARKLKGFVEDVDPLVVLERADGVCGICGEDVDPLDFHVDHIIPLARGGEHGYENTQPAHAACNRAKGAQEV